MVPALPTAQMATQAVLGELHKPLKSALFQDILWSVMTAQVTPFIVHVLCARHCSGCYMYIIPNSWNCRLGIINPFCKWETESLSSRTLNKATFLVNAEICLHTQISLIPKSIQFPRAILTLIRKKMSFIFSITSEASAGALKLLTSLSSFQYTFLTSGHFL